VSNGATDNQTQRCALQFSTFPEGRIAMIVGKLGLAFLAIAGSFTWAGCGPPAQPAAKAPAVIQPDQKRPRASAVQVKRKADNDTIRSRLLISETVQDDLDLTAEQREKIKGVVMTGKQFSREFAPKLREVFRPGDYSQEEWEARELRSRAVMDEVKTKRKELQTKALAILTPKQLERLKQIQLQTGIAATLEKPEISKSLGFSKEQTDQINAIRDRETEELRVEFPSINNLSRAERGQKLIEFQKKSDRVSADNRKAILGLLTTEQRTKLATIVGKPIEPKWSYDSLVPEDIGL
jgi:hypothetical protein